MSLSSRVFHRLFLSCRQASELMSHAQDEPLGAFARLRLAAHLAVCTYCRRFERQLALLRAAMQRYRR